MICTKKLSCLRKSIPLDPAIFGLLTFIFHNDLSGIYVNAFTVCKILLRVSVSGISTDILNAKLEEIKFCLQSSIYQAKLTLLSIMVLKNEVAKRLNLDKLMY